MIHIDDPRSLPELEPRLHRIITHRVAALAPELLAETEFVIVEAGDTEAGLTELIGLSPLVEPFDGKRWGEPGYWPWWDLLEEREGYYALTFTFGAEFAYVVIVLVTAGEPAEILALCRAYSKP